MFFNNDETNSGLIDLLAAVPVYCGGKHAHVDQEVALDPELLGQVFENLLASYNPETRQTARKADRFLLHAPRNRQLHGGGDS